MNIVEEIQSQINQLNLWTKAYDEGNPLISDKEWDKYYFDLMKLEQESGIYLPDSPTQKIHYEVMNSLNKVTHGHPMLSLAKTKDWNEFINYFESGKDVIGMLKMDGLTCSLHYSNGKLDKAETRGNGEVGEDILHNARVVSSIPKRINYTEDLTIDGEIICTYKDFEEFSNEYKNPRNFASGSIRLLDARECSKRKLTFVAWNVIEGFNETNSFSEKLTKLDDLGFIVVPWTSSFDWDAKDYLQDKAKELSYPIDGLVGRYDDIAFGEELGSTGHHARSAFAFKFYDEEYETRLINIIWQSGRGDELTPVAIFEPVDDGESIIERASLHNYSIMRDLLGDCAYVGQPIKVYKANAIIPQVCKVEDEYRLTYGEVVSRGGVSANDEPEFCPICGQALNKVESESGTINICCDNQLCGGKALNVIEHFGSKKAMDIKGLSKATIEKLLDWGWIRFYEDLYSLDKFKNNWYNKNGFGSKSVDNILKAIQDSRNCTLEQFICAIGIPEVGERVSKVLAEEFKTWDGFIEAVNGDYKFYNLPDFGIVMHNNIKNFDYEMPNRVAKLMNFKTVEKTILGDSLNGKKIAITGKLAFHKNRNALKSVIEQHGGKVVDSVTKTTSYLVNNDSTSTSSKNNTANRLGVPIITEEQLMKLLDNF